MGFVEEVTDIVRYFISLELDLLLAQALSARAGVRMTCLDLEFR